MLKCEIAPPGASALRLLEHYAAAEQPYPTTIVSEAAALRAIEHAQREARAAALEEAARIVQGEVYKHRYRTWPWFGDGNDSSDSQRVKFVDAAADAIRALAQEKPE